LLFLSIHPISEQTKTKKKKNQVSQWLGSQANFFFPYGSTKKICCLEKKGMETL
jgi:hypothetical protein